MKIKILTAIALFAMFLSLHAGGLEDMQGLELKHVKIPFYNERKLELLVFADSGKRQDVLMLCRDTFLDLLLDNIDVDKIPDGWQTRLYPLNSKLPAVLDFWKKRWNISDYVIFTPQSSINQSNSEAFGDDNVFLRAPTFDLDGIGFNADFKNQVIEIHSDVSIVVRSADSDPRKLFSGVPQPADYKYITASSDSLRLDRKNNELMLIGNVKVIDGRNTLTCDRLTVFLNSENGKDDYKKSVSPKDEKAVLAGVSRVLADGDVLLVQRPEDPEKSAAELQTSRSENLEYIIAQEKIILCGEESDPELTRGTDTRLRGKRIELLRHEDKVFVMGDCRVKSLVRDEQGKISYERDIISDRADFDGNTNIANFNGHVVAVDKETVMTCQSLRIHTADNKKTSDQKVELVLGRGNVKIVNRSEKEMPDVPGKKTVSVSTICSKQAELNYRTDKLIFYENVKVRDQESALDCDRLDIFMADRPSDARKDVSSAPLAAGAEGQNKTVTKIIANGRVYMKSGNDVLNTDLLTLFFRDLPKGVKPSPGMIQSGGVQLIKILCDGSVVARSMKEKTDTRLLKADHAMNDLLADYSEFHGNVFVQDDISEIYCRDMYIFTGRSPVPETSAKQMNAAAGNTASPDDDENIDDDPFEIDMGENSVPSRIALSDEQDLKRVVCKKEVVLLRRDKNGKIQRAGGDMAVYTVENREVVITAERPRRPWLRSDGRKQFSDIIRSDMATEDLQGIGNVQVLPDDGR